LPCNFGAAEARPLGAAETRFLGGATELRLGGTGVFLAVAFALPFSPGGSERRSGGADGRCPGGADGRLLMGRGGRGAVGTISLRIVSWAGAGMELRRGFGGACDFISPAFGGAERRAGGAGGLVLDMPILDAASAWQWRKLQESELTE
jgi:hypothetical protein